MVRALSLLALIVATTPAFAGDHAVTVRLRGQDSDGQRTRVRLAVRDAGDGRFQLRRIETDDRGRERAFRGDGVLSGSDLTVTFTPLLGKARSESRAFEAIYRVGGTKILGITQTPAWDQSDRRVWTEEVGELEGQTPWSRPPAAAESSPVEPQPARPVRSEARSVGRSARARTVARSDSREPLGLGSTPNGGGPLVRDADDQRLFALQRAAVDVARAELAKGVREVPARSNRGAQIDVYARTAGMPTGGAWCGYFLGYCYTQAARRQGLEFAGRVRLHSVGKTRSFFNYRVYTQRATRERIAEWEALRTQHHTSGGTRRYLTLEGSGGSRWAAARGLVHEIYASPRELPIRPGDAVLFSNAGSSKRTAGRGHLALVERYERSSGVLVTLEGNSADRVRRRTRNLSQASVRELIDGFGRPALSDFSPRSE